MSRSVPEAETPKPPSGWGAGGGFRELRCPVSGYPSPPPAHASAYRLDQEDELESKLLEMAEVKFMVGQI
jgi:hypothetical protein